MKLPIDVLRLDGGTQQRAAINQAVVSEYAELVMASIPFKEDPVVFFDSVNYWVADGVHRTLGTKQAGKLEIVVDLRQGTQRDAILYSLGANEHHGLRRTREDKRKAVVTALQDAEWGKLPDREIARMCAVTHPTVARIRAELNPPPPPPAPQREAGTFTTEGQGQQRDEQPAAPPPPAEAPAPAAGKSSTEGADEAGPEDGPTPAELMEEMRVECESLTKLVNTLQAEDKGAELVKLHKLAAHAQRQQTEAMAKAAEATKREAWAMRQLKRCGKAVGQDDPDKIAPSVEAFVRKHKVAA